MKNYIYILIAGVLTLTSCNDFLSRQYSSNEDPTSG
jgi:hypothetical protein